MPHDPLAKRHRHPGESPMTYWAIMLITILSGPMEGQKMPILYKTISECRQATTAVSDTLVQSYDHKIECVETDILSNSIKPEPRP
jgi:hypothetical protein